MNIYVGNLPFSTTEMELEELFSKYGHVESTKIVKDRSTGRSRGFGFVEMPDEQEAKEAVSNLDGFLVGQRGLRVNKARPREAKPRRFSDR
jgi:RNA recognition motif-containing protein